MGGGFINMELSPELQQYFIRFYGLICNSTEMYSSHTDSPIRLFRSANVSATYCLILQGLDITCLSGTYSITRAGLMKGYEPIRIGWWHQQTAALGLASQSVLLFSVLVISLLSVMLDLM